MLGFGTPVVAAGAVVTPTTSVGSTSGNSNAATRYPSVPFVVSCSVSHVSKDDPILHPGMPMASHTHAFFGNRSTNAKSTTASMSGATTSCRDPFDRAAYWLPTLKGRATWGDMRAYYSAGTVRAEAVQTYPTGIQLIAQQPYVRWSCSLGVNQNGWTAVPPKCPSGKSLAVRIAFPQCWSGLSVTDVRQTKYAVAGKCPAGYGKVLPELVTVVPVKGTFTGLEIGAANRMHADFWNFWVPARLEELVATCIRGERTNNADLKKCNVEGSGPA